jgi:hypothetical protein
MAKRPRWKSIVTWLIVGVVVLFGVGFLRISASLRADKKPLTKADVTNLATTLKQYLNEYRAFGASDNASVIRELRGANTREIVFFDAPAKRFNAKGEYVDLWGNAFRFDVSDPTNLRVWSCGPDGHDDGGKVGSDDIVNWR